MPTRKNHTSKKSNTKFRKTRAKRQTRKSKNKPRSNRQRGGVSRKGGSNPADDDYGDLFTNPDFAAIVAAEKEKERRKRRREEENAELIANMPNKADRNKNRHPVKTLSKCDRIMNHLGDHTNPNRGGGQMFGKPEQPTEPETPPECPICTEVFNDNYITTECGHKFHTECLIMWCRQHRETTTCPVCRGPIGRLCRELLFTELEKTLFDAINVGEIDFAEVALANSINNDGTPKYDNNNTLLLDINVKNKDGDTPLILAAKNHQVEIVDMLLKFGADVDELNDDGYSAFHETDNNEIINLLITFGTEHYDPTDDAVERNIFRFGNRGGKKSKKTRKKYKTKR